MSKYKQYTAIDTLIRDYANLHITKREFYKQLETVGGWDGYKALYSDVTKAEKYRANKLKDRDLEVLYICGPSGSGKTTLAKWIAQKLSYDPFISGGGDDILDGYDKEECIILDDFRASTMTFSELLKFLDNNTGSTVRSRYFNKDINNCKLIIITTIEKPDNIYGKAIHNDDGSLKTEPIEQFYRRLKHHFLFVSTKTDSVWELSLNGKFDKRELYKLQDMYDELGIKRDEVDDNSIINSIFNTNNE